MEPLKLSPAWEVAFLLHVNLMGLNDLKKLKFLNFGDEMNGEMFFVLFDFKIFLIGTVFPHMCYNSINFSHVMMNLTSEITYRTDLPSLSEV